MQETTTYAVLEREKNAVDYSNVLSTNRRLQHHARGVLEPPHTQLGHHLLVLGLVSALQVLQQTLALAQDHLQAAGCAKVLAVHFEVRRQLLHACCQSCNLCVCA